jgi:hypothetical protein
VNPFRTIAATNCFSVKSRILFILMRVVIEVTRQREAGINKARVCEKGQKGARPYLIYAMMPGEPVTAVSTAMPDQLSRGTVGVLPGTG